MGKIINYEKIELIMFRFLITLIISFFLHSNLFAEIVKKFNVKGNNRISSETIKVYGQIKPLNSDFSASDINNILTN